MIETVNIQDVHNKVNGLKLGYSMMECPKCKSDLKKVYDKRHQIWKFDSIVSPMRYRYICGECKLPVQYET